jgi:type I restriction enzyme R subunit
VLFVNGIPLVVAECKSPGIQNPLQEAINQLLRYSNQRKELFPTLYNENEGVERLFHTNQLLVASNFFEARAATISHEQVEAEQEVAALGPEQSERAGTPLFFRKPEQRPIAMRSAHATLQSQQVLAAGMLRPVHLLDLVRNFTVFQQVDGKTRKVVARYQQFRSIHKAVARLQDGRTRRVPIVVASLSPIAAPSGGLIPGESETVAARLVYTSQSARWHGSECAVLLLRRNPSEIAGRDLAR